MKPLKRRTGFAALSPERVREIASSGGRAKSDLAKLLSKDRPVRRDGGSVQQPPPGRLPAEDSH